MQRNYFFVLILLLTVSLVFLFGCTTSPSFCGDTICSPDENTSTCERDCPVLGGEDTNVIVTESVCGNRVCEAGETYSNCSSDCNRVGNTKDFGSKSISLSDAAQQFFVSGKKVILTKDALGVVNFDDNYGGLCKPASCNLSCVGLKDESSCSNANGYCDWNTEENMCVLSRNFAQNDCSSFSNLSDCTEINYCHWDSRPECENSNTKSLGAKTKQLYAGSVGTVQLAPMDYSFDTNSPYHWKIKFDQTASCVGEEYQKSGPAICLANRDAINNYCASFNNAPIPANSSANDICFCRTNSLGDTVCAPTSQDITALNRTCESDVICQGSSPSTTYGIGGDNQQYGICSLDYTYGACNELNENECNNTLSQCNWEETTGNLNVPVWVGGDVLAKADRFSVDGNVFVKDYVDLRSAAPLTGVVNSNVLKVVPRGMVGKVVGQQSDSEPKSPVVDANGNLWWHVNFGASGWLPEEMLQNVPKKVFSCINGCLSNNTCLAYWQPDTSGNKYCDPTVGKMVAQKSQGQTCLYNSQCTTDLCSPLNKCATREELTAMTSSGSGVQAKVVLLLTANSR